MPVVPRVNLCPTPEVARVTAVEEVSVTPNPSTVSVLLDRVWLPEARHWPSMNPPLPPPPPPPPVEPVTWTQVDPDHTQKVLSSCCSTMNPVLMPDSAARDAASATG